VVPKDAGDGGLFLRILAGCERELGQRDGEPFPLHRGSREGRSDLMAPLGSARGSLRRPERIDKPFNGGHVRKVAKMLEERGPSRLERGLIVEQILAYQELHDGRRGACGVLPIE
jgi:hypothetical protein